MYVTMLQRVLSKFEPLPEWFLKACENHLAATSPQAGIFKTQNLIKPVSTAAEKTTVDQNAVAKSSELRDEVTIRLKKSEAEIVIPNLAEEMRAMPSRDNQGTIEGIKIMDINQKSLAPIFGLKKEDILLNYNDNAILSFHIFMVGMNTIKQQSKGYLLIKREMKLLRINYLFESSN